MYFYAAPLKSTSRLIIGCSRYLSFFLLKEILLLEVLLSATGNEAQYIETEVILS